MRWEEIKKIHCATLCFFLFLIFSFFSFNIHKVEAVTIAVSTTTVDVSICDNGIVDPGETCDDGLGNNNGGYSTSISGRTCESTCLAFGPYCGDSILQTIEGEECDDGNNTSGDFCDGICQAEQIFPGGGGGGGGGFSGGTNLRPPDSQVIIQGKAYPNSTVNILKDGSVIGVVTADAKADFFFTLDGVTPGPASFGFWSTDNSGLRSVSFNTTFQVSLGAVTTVSGVFIPPTIDLDKRQVKQGEIINMRGQSVPEVVVRTVVNSSHEIINEVETDEEGNWELDFDTIQLEEDIHSAKAQFEIVSGGAQTESGFSQAITFFVGDEFVGELSTSDLNLDGKVNIVDFSILLFHWQTDGGSSNPPADINLDGTVSLTDFSIMIFNWTG